MGGGRSFDVQCKAAYMISVQSLMETFLKAIKMAC
jgi:hypothetical protein